MLIDVHAHFYHAATPRADWRERNASRLAAGRKIGVTIHVASILGTWGRTSPIYFPSPRDVEDGNTALLALQREHPDLIRGYVTVNPNYTPQACAEIARCVAAGMVGIKLAASRRATDPLLDPICELARERGLPVLHHVWQHRRRDCPGQEPPRRRPPTAPGCGAGGGTGASGPAPGWAAPEGGRGGAGSVGRTGARRLGRAPPAGAVHPGAHGRRRRWGTLTRRLRRCAPG